MKNHRFLWLRNRTTDNRKCEKARNIKEKRTIEMFSTASKPLVAHLSSASADRDFKMPKNPGNSTVSGVFLFVLFWLNLTQPNRFYRGQLGDNSPFFRLYGTTSGTTTGTTFRHLGVTISALNDQPFLRHAEGI